MPGLSASRAAFKAKSLGLRVNTNLPPNDFQHVPSPDDQASCKGEIFTQLATAPAAKVHFSNDVQVFKPATSKASEALLSTDWRKDCRQQGPLPTAPAKKVQFSSDEIKPQKPKFDATAVENYGLRRYRDTPVDPDFIRSAPATKKEFDIARDEDDHIDEEDEEDEDDDHIFFRSPSSQTTGFKQTSQRNMVQLKQLISAPKESESAVTRSSGSTGMSPYFVVSPVYDAKGPDLEFPFAEIQAVKHGKRFQTKAWDDLEPAVKHKLLYLEAPRTAGLPVEALRREFKQRQEEAEAELQKAAETMRFNALLEKLQKSRKATEARKHTRRPSIIDIKPPFWTKNLEKEENHADGAGRKSTEQRRPSHDSAISGLSIDADKKPSCLNPKAPEFCFTSPKEQSPKATVIVSVDQFKDMCSRLKNLELAMEKKTRFPNIYLPKPRGSSGNFTLGMLKPDLDPNLVRPLPNNFMSPQSQNSHQPLPQHVKKYLERYPDGNAPSNATYYLVDQHKPPVRPVQTMAQPGLSAPFQTQQNGAGAPFMNHLPSAIPQQPPVYVHNQLATGPPMQSWNHAIPHSSPNGFVAGAPPQGPYAGMLFPTYPFGPKPVRKPRGLPRPDFRQTMQQQEYEAYLEHKRSTNIEYAKACRNRQARRAERERSQRA